MAKELSINVCGDEKIYALVFTALEVKVWINDKYDIEKAQEFWTEWFYVNFPTPSISSVCGLKNITFYTDSAL